MTNLLAFENSRSARLLMWLFVELSRLASSIPICHHGIWLPQTDIHSMSIVGYESIRFRCPSSSYAACLTAEITSPGPEVHPVITSRQYSGSTRRMGCGDRIHQKTRVFRYLSSQRLERSLEFNNLAPYRNSDRLHTPISDGSAATGQERGSVRER